MCPPKTLKKNNIPPSCPRQIQGTKGLKDHHILRKKLIFDPPVDGKTEMVKTLPFQYFVCAR